MSELYISNNRIQSLNECCELEKLQIIDASSNPIDNMLEISKISSNKQLKLVKLSGTEICKLPEFPNIFKKILQSVKLIITQEETTTINEFSAYSQISAFLFDANEIKKAEKKLPEPKQTQKPTQNKGIGNIIEAVSARQYYIVSQRNIKESVQRGNAFNNPIASMMIAPATSRVGKLINKKQVLVQKSTPNCPIPSSTKSINGFYYIYRFINAGDRSFFYIRFKEKI